MVVTPSRLHTVRSKEAIDRYLNEHNYSEIRALVDCPGNVLGER